MHKMKNTTAAFMLGSLLLVSSCAPQYGSSAGISSNYDDVRRVETDEIANPLSPFISATLAERDSDEVLAATYYMRALENDPNNLFVAEKAFFQLVTAGQIGRAIEIAPSLLGVESIAPLAHLVLATKALKSEDAKTVLQHAIEIEKTAIGYLFSPLMQGWGNAIKKDNAGAFNALSRLKGNPVIQNLAKAHEAYILDYMGNIDSADTAYKSLIASKSLTSLQPIAAYGDFLYRHHREQDARDMFAKEISNNNNNMFLLREAQRHMLGLGPTLSVATPKGAMAHFYFRMATEGYRERPDLLTLFYGRLAEYLSPASEDIKLLLGEILTKLDRPAAAARAYAVIPQNSPAAHAAFMRQVEALRSSENYGAAEVLLKRELIKRPNNKRLLSLLADLFRIQGLCDQAIPLYDQIIAGFGRPEVSQWFNYFARGSCHELEGSWPLGEADLLVTLRLVPENAMVLNYLGYSWLSRSIKLDQARKLIEKAAAKDPENGSIIDSLGWVQYKTQDIAAAVETLERAVRLSPGNSVISDHLGDAYWKSGRLREARFEWRHALATAEDDENIERIKAKMIYGLVED